MEEQVSTTITTPTTTKMPTIALMHEKQTDPENISTSDSSALTSSIFMPLLITTSVLL